MRKLFILSCCSVAFLFLVTACENKDPEAQQLGEKFIKELYKMDDPNVDISRMSTEQLIESQNKFSTYFTEQEFTNLTTKRFFLIPLEAASKQNSKISVQNISLKKAVQNQKEGNPLDFDHTFTLIFTDQDGNKIDEEEIKGQMSIVDTKNGLKIDRYYDEALKALLDK